MKYANIFYGGKNTINMGDVLLLLSAQNLLYDMGLHESDVGRINYNDLSDYSGEKVILPIVSAFMGYHDGRHITCFSSNIQPVFLCLCITTNVLNDEDISYLKKFSPIGCRDYHTLSTMRKYGIPAYLSGCITLTMRFWEKERRISDTVYFVDADPELIGRAPDNIVNDKCVFCSQILDITGPENIEEEVYERYLEYFRFAKLVVTSRLHCALPCIMAGIPVIFAGRVFENRFSWLEKQIKFYDLSEWDSIDWNPKANSSLFDVSHTMREFLISRMRLDLSGVSEYSAYSNSVFEKQREYLIWAYESMKEKIDDYVMQSGRDNFDYMLWGMGQVSDMMFDYIHSHYSKSKFLGMIDSKVVGEYGGKPIVRYDDLSKEYFALMIVMPVTLIGEEKEKVRKELRNRVGCTLFLTDVCIKTDDLRG